MIRVSFFAFLLNANDLRTHSKAFNGILSDDQATQCQHNLENCSALEIFSEIEEKLMMMQE